MAASTLTAHSLLRNKPRLIVLQQLQTDYFSSRSKPSHSQPLSQRTGPEPMKPASPVIDKKSGTEDPYNYVELEATLEAARGECRKTSMARSSAGLLARITLRCIGCNFYVHDIQWVCAR